ncbi:hypothetical protein O181_053727 [Austropuccinia psidii MF-1]|uniref:Fungal lipase-type domain-containing protein n=1 Tax=Austropuccinia psidii MF-1 TaxID=1389203 RepID=A0A9Q3E5G0_9BASI|nr:hypothetical protein [Austropuccinia psidii MF-1]
MYGTRKRSHGLNVTPTEDLKDKLNYKEAKELYDHLSALQRCFLVQHAEEFQPSKESLNQKLIKSIISFLFTMTIQFLGSPVGLLTRPHHAAILIAYFTLVYGFLICSRFVFFIAERTGLKNYLEDSIKQLVETEKVFINKDFLEKEITTTNICNWMDLRILTGKEGLIENSREVLTGKLPDFNPLFDETKGPLLSSSKLIFDVDVACSVLLMCASVYERDSFLIEAALRIDSTKKPQDLIFAKEDITERQVRLLSSEKTIHKFAQSWGLKFICIPDFRGLDGPFIGVFYKINVQPDENPFAVITIKGTSLDNFSEWLIDCAYKFESASDFLNTGSAHYGFYNTLFPSKSNELRVLPYRRIVEAVKLIAEEAQRAPRGQNKKLNLFVTGHSLGAGIAQLLYARLLETPSDMGNKILLRDAYVFGTPRACDFKLASRVDYNLNKSVNQGRQLWRISNRASLIGDIVTEVPPGVANKREIRSGLQEGSPFSYAAIGTSVDLFPNGQKNIFNISTWFGHASSQKKQYKIGDTPVGFKPEIANKLIFKYRIDPRPSFWGSLRPFSIIGITMSLIAFWAPFVHDHLPACYLESLTKMENEL